MRPPLSIRHRRSTPTARLSLIVVMGIVSAFLSIAAGLFLYRNTLQLLEAGQWVAHTQEVLISLQTAMRFTERVESGSALYAATANSEQLDAARLSAVRLGTLSTHLKSLTADNQRQFGNAQDFESCTADMTRALQPRFDEDGVKIQGLRCHKALQLMSEQEQQLLEQRAAVSRNKTQVSIYTEIAFAFLALCALAFLFGLLVRDAARRNRTNRKLSSTIHALENQALLARQVTTMRQELQLCLNVEQVYRSAALRLPQLLPHTAGTLYVMNSSHNLLESVSSWNGEGCNSHFAEVFAQDGCCGLRAGQLRWRRAGVSELDCDHFQGPAPAIYLCVPLVAHGETLGVISVEASSEESVQNIRGRLEGLQQFVQLIAMTLAGLRLRTKLEAQSVRDQLTGLFNRHFMQIAFERELSRAARRKSSLAVIMLDIDHFKRLNDKWGHSAGDAALKEVAGVLRGMVRAEDIVCRYGGEEFVLILPDITPDAALERAEKLRLAVASLRIQFERTSLDPVTISLGVALFPVDGEIPERLLKQADTALYSAKHSGRNRVVLSSLEIALS